MWTTRDDRGSDYPHDPDYPLLSLVCKSGMRGSARGGRKVPDPSTPSYSMHIASALSDVTPRYLAKGYIVGGQSPQV